METECKSWLLHCFKSVRDQQGEQLVDTTEGIFEIIRSGVVMIRLVNIFVQAKHRIPESSIKTGNSDMDHLRNLGEFFCFCFCFFVLLLPLSLICFCFCFRFSVFGFVCFGFVAFLQIWCEQLL